MYYHNFYFSEKSIWSAATQICSLNTDTADVSETGILSNFPTEQAIREVSVRVCYFH